MSIQGTAKTSVATSFLAVLTATLETRAPIPLLLVSAVPPTICGLTVGAPNGQSGSPGECLARRALVVLETSAETPLLGLVSGSQICLYLRISRSRKR